VLKAARSGTRAPDSDTAGGRSKATWPENRVVACFKQDTANCRTKSTVTCGPCGWFSQGGSSESWAGDRTSSDGRRLSADPDRNATRRGQKCRAEAAAGQPRSASSLGAWFLPSDRAPGPLCRSLDFGRQRTCGRLCNTWDGKRRGGQDPSMLSGN